jgi:hypothetical protein
VQNPKGGLLKPNPKMNGVALDVPQPASPSQDDEYLTDEQICQILGVTKQWLRDHTTRVEPILPHIRLGRKIVYPRRVLFEWMNARVETRPNWER